MSEVPLGLLEVAGLIRQEGSNPEPEFSFRHTLLRDTAYGSLLREERKALHREVGRVMERVYPRPGGEQASLLAHHFLMADLKDKALIYLRRAGDEAARVYAVPEALDLYQRALALAAEGQGGKEDLDYLYDRRGRMLELAGRYSEALENYRELEQAGREHGEPRRELRGLVRQATLYSIPSAVMDREKGRLLSEQALEMARTLGDRTMESLAHWNLMRVYEYGLEFSAAREHGERALELVESLDLPEQKAFILNDLATIYLSTGDFLRGVEVNRRAVGLWQELDNLPMLVDAYSSGMILEVVQGNYEHAEALSNQAAAISERIGNLWGESYSRYMVYWVHADRGEIGRALTVARECIEFAERAGFVVPSFQTQADIGALHAYLGEFEKAHHAIDQAVSNAQGYMPAWQVYPLGIRALTLVWQGKIAEAEPVVEQLGRETNSIPRGELNFINFFTSLVYPEFWLAKEEWERALAEADRYLELFESNHNQLFKSDLFLHRGLALIGLQRFEEAKAALEQGVAQAQKVGSRRTLWRLHDVLAYTAKELGAEAEAVEHRDRRQEVVEFIADHAGDDGGRKAFLRRVARLSLATPAD